MKSGAADNAFDVYPGETTFLLGAILNSKAGKLRLDTDNFVFDPTGLRQGRQLRKQGPLAENFGVGWREPRRPRDPHRRRHLPAQQRQCDQLTLTCLQPHRSGRADFIFMLLRAIDANVRAECRVRPAHHRVVLDHATDPIEHAWLAEMFARDDHVPLDELAHQLDDYVGSLNPNQG